MEGDALERSFDDHDQDQPRYAHSSVLPDAGDATIEIENHEQFDPAKLRRLKASIAKCCEAIAANSTAQAYELVSELRDQASPTGTAVERLAFYFSEALVARITGTGSLLYNSLTSKRPIEEILQIFATVAERFPGFGLPIFFTNQTILDETAAAAGVHVIDFGIGPGYRWLCLIKDFSERSGGPPHFRLTAVDRPDNSLFHSQEALGAKLRGYARSVGVPFDFHSVVTADWDSIEASELMIQPRGETLIVAAFHKLRELPDDPRRRLLRNIHAMRPRLFLNAAFPAVSLTAPSLVARAREAFDCYAGMFGSIAAGMGEARFAGERRFLEQLRGLALLNTLACEGEDRVERPDGCKQWEELMRGAGFEGYEIKRHVYAGAKRMLGTYSNWRDYSVGRSGNWMLLRWNRQLNYAISSWMS